MTEPTRTTTTRMSKDEETGLATVVEEFQSLHSVELTCSAKGAYRISSLKIYSQDPFEAARIAVEVAQSAHNALKESGLPVEKG